MTAPQIKDEYWTAHCNKCGKRRIGDLRADGSVDIPPCPLPVEILTVGIKTTTNVRCKGTAVDAFQVHK